jgi:hypothetical protein
MKHQIEVEIKDFDVDSEYYTFSYKVSVDGKLKDKGEINDDYENGMTPKEWQTFLEKEEALNLIMVRVFE